MKKLTLIIVALLLSQNAFAQEEAIQEEKPQIKITEHVGLSYGPHGLHALDVYVPEDAKKAPIILMVHGGAWRWGDKASKNLVENKLAKWGQEGFVIASTNYRVLPTLPFNQAHDVRHALKYIQANATKWNGDPDKVILLGHSAGAHLVALVNANPDIAYKLGAKPWLGAIALDTAALDVVSLMKGSHESFYDRAFGTKLYDWRKSSPYAQLTKKAPPMFLVCSTKREKPCPAAEDFAKKADELGVTAEILPQDLSHKNINKFLGYENDYTPYVDGFINRLLGRPVKEMPVKKAKRQEENQTDLDQTEDDPVVSH